MKMNSTSPKSSLAKLGLHTKPKPIRVLIVGHSGVGKTAMVVRFVTRRFIGEYDQSDKTYTYNTIIDNEIVLFEIMDVARKLNESDNTTLETNIKWADAFILMYSVTDKCSFDDCNRLKFLINYNKSKRKLGSNPKDGCLDVPVILVGNKTDQYGDRMVQLEDGQKRFREISCACFHEISVRESSDQVWGVFRDVCRFWRVFNKFPKLKRSTSDVRTNSEYVISPDSIWCYFDGSLRSEKRRSFLVLGRPTATAEQSPDESDEHSNNNNSNNNNSNLSGSSKNELETPFRERASTDGTIFSRRKRWQYPPPGSLGSQSSIRVERRMSISMRGSNSSY